MAEESSHSQDLNNAFIIERTPTKGTKRKKYTLDFKCKVIEAAKNSPSSRAVALQYGIDESILLFHKQTRIRPVASATSSKLQPAF